MVPLVVLGLMRAYPLRTAVILILAVSLGIGVAASYAAARWTTPESRALVLARAHKFAEAAHIYKELLESEPATLPRMMAFLEANRAARALREAHAMMPMDDAAPPPPPPVDEPTVSRLILRLTPDEGVLASYWHALSGGLESTSLRREVLALADRDPPAPFANHVLARALELDRKLFDAASRYRRECEAFDKRRDDCRRALALYEQLGMTEEVQRFSSQPRFASDDPVAKMQAASGRRAYFAAAYWSIVATYKGASGGQLALAIMAALSWFAFCVEVGRVGDKPRVRVPLYAAAFALGIFSVWPTLAVVFFEDEVLKLKPSGNAARDIVYYVGGVGLREELMKGLAFASLVPVLRRVGGPREFLACGALVGLGFAAEENVGYFQSGALGTSLARFLTANFFHIAATAMVASAVVKYLKDPRRDIGAPSKTFLMVVLLHGAYDFFIASSEASSLSFLSVVTLVFLTRMFLLEVKWLRDPPMPRRPRWLSRLGPPLVVRFALGLALLAGASYVYASTVVGPLAGAAAMAEGMLGVAILLFVYHRELEHV